MCVHLLFSSLPYPGRSVLCPVFLLQPPQPLPGLGDLGVDLRLFFAWVLCSEAAVVVGHEVLGGLAQGEEASLENK